MDDDDDMQYDSGMDLSPEESAEQLGGDNDGDDGNFGFADVVPEKLKKRGYEVDYVVLERKEIVARQERESGEIQGVLGVSLPVSAVLLRSFKWKQEKLIDKYMEDPDAVLKKVGATLDQGYAAGL